MQKNYTKTIFKKFALKMCCEHEEQFPIRNFTSPISLLKITFLCHLFDFPGKCQRFISSWKISWKCEQLTPQNLGFIFVFQFQQGYCKILSSQQQKTSVSPKQYWYMIKSIRIRNKYTLLMRAFSKSAWHFHHNVIFLKNRRISESFKIALQKCCSQSTATPPPPPPEPS
jgi:hypothetical protein